MEDAREVSMALSTETSVFVNSSSFEKYVAQPKPQAKIWRYMDFTKYVSLLQNSSLFCPQLCRFDDKHEGSFSLFIPKTMRRAILANEWIHKEMHDGATYYRTHFAASCWHMNNNESAALWKLYLSSNEGIAVQTTVEKLLNSLKQEPHLKGNVLYVTPDWEGATNVGSDIVPFIKRASFEHEHEYRLIFHGDDLDKQSGVSIPVTLKTLIETVYV